MMQEIYETLKNTVEDYFKEDSTGHDIFHLERTMKVALKIQEKEGGDRLVIGTAGYLHDVHRILSKKQGGFCSPKESLPEVEKLMAGIKLSPEQKKKVLHAIEYHEEYAFSKNGRTASDIETLVLQDADNLDAIGAIGVARTFMFGGAHKLPMWNPDIPVKKGGTYDETDANDPTTVHHIYRKLLRMKDTMNTKTGKLWAEKRQRFIEGFLTRFLQEWDGTDMENPKH